MKLKTLVAALVAAGLAGTVIAQERVLITGSSIKRLADEGALPLQVISAEEIRQQGITTAEELLNNLGASAAHLDNAVSRNNVFGAEQDRLTGGGSFANLRGLGPTGTLVLLNGRRISTHGMSGGAVDLNAIPMAAVARVEVLKDGASAIYGTDAIGGVVNFILTTAYQGVSIGGNYAQPLESSGGTTRRAFVTAGTGESADEPAGSSARRARSPVRVRREAAIRVMPGRISPPSCRPSAVTRSMVEAVPTSSTHKDAR